jgi:hypothetical protein
MLGSHKLNKLLMFYRQYMMADAKRYDGLYPGEGVRSVESDDAHIAWMMEQLEQHCWDWTELAGQDGVWTNDKKMRWLRNDKITNLVSGESIKPGRWQRRPPSNSSNSGS